MIIFLDAGPLGQVTNPNMTAEALACTQWMEQRLEVGDEVLVPEIADFEVRRELLRARKTAGIRQLDLLKASIGYVALTTEMMLLAAEFWAAARQRGRPTAGNQALDADVILAAQVEVFRRQDREVVLTTGNVGHLAQFTDARPWREIG